MFYLPPHNHNPNLGLDTQPWNSPVPTPTSSPARAALVDRIYFGNTTGCICVHHLSNAYVPTHGGWVPQSSVKLLDTTLWGFCFSFAVQWHDMKALTETLYIICIFIWTKSEAFAVVRDASRAWVWHSDNSHSQPIVQPLLHICKTKLTHI